MKRCASTSTSPRKMTTAASAASTHQYQAQSSVVASSANRIGLVSSATAVASRPSRFHSRASASECSFTLRVRSAGCCSPGATATSDCKTAEARAPNLDESTVKKVDCRCRPGSAYLLVDSEPLTDSA